MLTGAVSESGVCRQVGLVYLSEKMGQVVKGLLLATLIGVLIVIFTPLGFPFTSSDAASKQRVVFIVSGSQGSLWGNRELTHPLTDFLPLSLPLSLLLSLSESEMHFTLTCPEYSTLKKPSYQ